MILSIPSAVLALSLVQSPVACDWANRPDGRFYVCAAPENKSAIIAFVCDGNTKALRQINFTIVTGQQGISGRMSVKNAGNEVQIPMIGLRTGLNGFASPAIGEAFEATIKFLEAAKGPLTYGPADSTDAPAVAMDGGSIGNALKTATAACKGT
jgi:hypothetical protein